MVVLCSLTVTPGPKAKVAQQGTHRDENVTMITGQGIICFHIRSQIRNEVFANLLHVIKRITWRVRLCLRHQRFRKERHPAIINGQLQISPCTESFHCGILPDEHFLTTQGKCRIGMGYIIITVLNDGIIILRRIVTVVCRCREACQFLQVGRGRFRRGRKFSHHFSENNRTVGHHLHLVHNA